MQSLWMLAASFLFALMGVCVKLAADSFSTSEIVLVRGVIGMLFVGALIRLRGGTLKTPLARHHLWRGAVGVAALWMWFYSISLLPLATAVTLNYMSPIWIAVIVFGLGWWRGRAGADWRLAAAIALGFGGVAMLLQPSLQRGQGLGAAMALASGVLAALAYLAVRRLGQMGEPEYRVVFYFSLTGAIAGLAGALWLEPHASHGWRLPDVRDALLLAAIGITATSAQMAMTRAYRLGNTLLTANLQYTGIVFSSLFGVLIWHDALGPAGWLGIAAILVSGIAATFYNVRGTPPKPVAARFSPSLKETP
ncbi:MAG: DMT family transporter [Burkholderiaceae bacterium]